MMRTGNHRVNGISSNVLIKICVMRISRSAMPPPLLAGFAVAFVCFRGGKSLTINTHVYIITLTHMTTQKHLRPNNEKIRLLRSCGALYPKPETVQDEAFAHNEFFDSRDAVQVKYEMVRRHRVDARPVTEVAKSFGVSRQTFYKTVSVFKVQGIPGLLPQRRGPKQPHKCTEEILDFAERWSVLPVAERGEDLVKAIQRQFRVTLHPRSIDRALAKRKKKRQRRQERRA